jgi:hypothetical protein
MPRLADEGIAGADAIFFSPSYFPHETDLNKIVLAKTVFSKVFAPGSKFSSENPLPPCATSEFNLLKEGLTNRLYNIRMILPDNRQDLEDSMALKNTYRTAEEINTVIQAIEDQKTNCTDYQLNLESGIAEQIPAYEKPISRADTERMQNLLRQFSFLILQSMNPVAGYEDKIGSITPNFLLEGLEQQQISKEEMDQYLAEYGIEHEIPDTISQALQSTNSQDNIYSLMLESELANLIKYVKDNVSKKLNNLALKAEFNGKTKQLENSPVRQQIMGILDWLLDKYSANKKVITDNIDAINKHSSVSSVLNRDLEAKNAEMFECPHKDCDYSSLTKANRRIHYFRVHMKDIIDKNVTKLDEGAGYDCKSCEKILKSQTSLYYHIGDCLQLPATDKRIAHLKIIV